MTASESLMGQARTVFGEAGPYSNRAACWIARAALEAAVDDLLDSKTSAAPAASMRSRLTLLQVAYASDLGVGERAGFAWSRLSSACHQHAFELTPSGVEVRDLLDQVESLIAEGSQTCPDA